MVVLTGRGAERKIFFPDENYAGDGKQSAGIEILRGAPPSFHCEDVLYHNNLEKATMFYFRHVLLCDPRGVQIPVQFPAKPRL